MAPDCGQMHTESSTSQLDNINGIASTEDSLKILSWNVNGLRSLENLPDWLRRLDADILSFQETKLTRDMLTEPLAIIPGYTSYYAFSRGRQGYSGVATYVRYGSTPSAAEEGITGHLVKGETEIGGTDHLHIEFTQEELKSLDAEGRCVITKHQIKSSGKSEAEREYLILINVYCPRADPEREDRKRFKMLFYKALDIRANTLRAQGNHVVVVGDINTSHRILDHCDPYEEFSDHPGRRFLTHFLASVPPTGVVEKAMKHSQSTDISASNHKQFSVEENKVEDEGKDLQVDDWVCGLVSVEEQQFIDTFRMFHGQRENAFTCWNTKMNCRSTNYGTRIDYIFISLDLQNRIRSADIHPDVEGSDHCPISAVFSFRLEAAAKPPLAATKNFPEFQGKQLSIKELFSTSAKRERSPENTLKVLPVKKSKTSNTKITNFFMPKNAVAKTSTIAETEYHQLSNQKSTNQSISFLSTGITAPTDRNGESKAAWGKLFRPAAPAPRCTKHQEECLKRRVTKKGPNQGRQFYVCPRGEGRSDDPNASCNFFKWAK